MKVVLINRSDLLGGAAVATRRLMLALREQGTDARMLVCQRLGDEPGVALCGNAWSRRRAFLAERAAIYLRNGRRRDTLFQIDTATHGINVSRHPWVRAADVIMLGWVNQGMLSLDDIARLGQLGKPMIWTMHDMWPCTGVCHHAHACSRYGERCAGCPLLPAGSRLATRTLLRKADLYDRLPILFVAVSHWLAECCDRSRLLAGRPADVIANPFPSQEFAWDYRPLAGVPANAVVLAMGAARLDDPIKGFDLLVAAMRHLRSYNPSLADRIHLLLYGDLRDRSLLDSLPVGHTHLGYVSHVNEVFRAAHIVVSTSRYESFGYTLVEGMASGCVPVTTGLGGQVDIVRHLHNGYVTGTCSPADIARGIEWAAAAALDRKSQHQWVAEHFDSQIIARQYLELIHKNDFT